MTNKPIPGNEVENLDDITIGPARLYSRRGSETKKGVHGQVLRPARLLDRGYKAHTVDSKGRVSRWETPDGRIVSKYRAYRELGLPMLNAREWARINSLEGDERARA